MYLTKVVVNVCNCKIAIKKGKTMKIEEKLWEAFKIFVVSAVVSLVSGSKPVITIASAVLAIITIVLWTLKYDEVSENIKLAELQLSKQKREYVRVLPITSNNFVKRDLPQKARFYAVLNTREKQVIIFVRFNDDNEQDIYAMHFFETVRLANFLDAYEVYKEKDQ